MNLVNTSGKKSLFIKRLQTFLFKKKCVSNVFKKLFLTVIYIRM